MKKRTLTDTQERKKKLGICITLFCTKKGRKKKGGGKCHSCIEHQKEESDPVKYRYNQWKKDCKKRKKVFTVTLEEFRSFVIKNPDYMRKKGRGLKKLTISRKEECVDGCPREWCQAHGYHYHNIESATLKENLFKYVPVKKFSDVPF